MKTKIIGFLAFAVALGYTLFDIASTYSWVPIILFLLFLFICAIFSLVFWAVFSNVSGDKKVEELSKEVAQLKAGIESSKKACLSEIAINENTSQDSDHR